MSKREKKNPEEHKKPGRKAETLTPLQEQFCREYLIDLNASKAAERAGYTQKSSQAGYETLKRRNVQKRIQELMDERSKRTEITADRVLCELARVAFLDLSEAYDDNGNLLNIKAMPEDVRRAISGIKVFDEFDGTGNERFKIGEVREVKTNDKIKALQAIGQHLKMFTQKHEHSGPDGKPIETKNVSSMSAQEMEKRIEELLKKRSGCKKNQE